MSAGSGAGRHVLERDGLERLFEALRERGYQVVGPTLRDAAIVYDALGSSADLPIGWTDEQDGGSYRLHRRGDDACFGYAVGPDAWKRFLYPPEQRLWRAVRSGDGFETIAEEPDDTRYAFLGVRACDLAAIEIHDRVFLGAPHPDPGYRRRREAAFVVAVNCTAPAGTCFCSSLGNGPAASGGFDLALTELLDEDGHRFLIESGSPGGAELLAELPLRAAGRDDEAAAAAALGAAAAGMERQLDTAGLKELLQEHPDHPHWDDVAARCLTCGNCTMVCPTCFCTTVDDVTDLAGGQSERVRRWDSCFTLDFSYLHGGSVRSSAKSRYRQWLTHKLAGWVDQFDQLGCVGCGRCIAWCPVGIDLTAEVVSLRSAGHDDSGEGASVS